MNPLALRIALAVTIVCSYANCLCEHVLASAAHAKTATISLPDGHCGHDESGCFCRGATLIAAVPIPEAPLASTLPMQALLPAIGTVVTTLDAATAPFLISETHAQGDAARTGRQLRTLLASLQI